METLLLHDENRTYRADAFALRKRLLELGRQHKCETCGNDGHWNNLPMILEIDHIDGNWKNNNPDNLRFLCPNCHSQTPNFYNTKHPDYFKYCACGKQINKNSLRCSKCNNRLDKLYLRKAERPTFEVLQKLVYEKPIEQIAKDFGLSDKAIHKWCERLNIQKPKRGYWLKKMRD